MTEEQNVSGQVASDNSSTSHIVEALSSDNTAATEKMIPQSKVNEIVGAAKKSAYEKAHMDAMSQLKGTQSPVESSNNGDIKNIVNNQISGYLNDLYQAQQAEIAKHEAKKTLESLQVKVDAASKKYDDFEEVTKDIPYASFPNLLSASDAFDNSGDLLYHLGKNPSKFRELASSLSHDNPLRAVAMKELKNLSDSLKNNETAVRKGSSREPLGHIRPSNVVMDSGKKQTITDLRRKWRG